LQKELIVQFKPPTLELWLSYFSTLMFECMFKISFGWWCVCYLVCLGCLDNFM